LARAAGEGFYSFLFGLVLLASGGCSPQNLAAAKGEQVEKYITLFPFSVFSVSLWRNSPAPRPRNVQDKPGGKLFSAQPQPHCHQTVANSANGSFLLAFAAKNIYHQAMQE